MFKKFFDTSAIDAFAAWIVDELKRLRPVDRLESEAKAAVRQREQFEDGLRRHVDNFTGATSLNFFRKVRLGARIEEQVEAAGYPRAFGQQLSRGMARMSRGCTPSRCWRSMRASRWTRCAASTARSRRAPMISIC